jgi:hypothetical protein
MLKFGTENHPGVRDGKAVVFGAAVTHSAWQDNITIGPVTFSYRECHREFSDPQRSNFQPGQNKV